MFHPNLNCLSRLRAQCPWSETSSMRLLTFPQDFIWGTATASYQIEGGKGGEDKLHVAKQRSAVDLTVLADLVNFQKRACSVVVSLYAQGGTNAANRHLLLSRPLCARRCI